MSDKCDGRGVVIRHRADSSIVDLVGRPSDSNGVSNARRTRVEGFVQLVRGEETAVHFDVLVLGEIREKSRVWPREVELDIGEHRHAAVWVSNSTPGRDDSGAQLSRVSTLVRNDHRL